ncbi:MAG: DNA-binding response regulator [Candidatus Melainabacteria bacterium]|nr:MAG: DNA-binding response regulator [Candidatus Melainabacteria bacterium]
MAKILVVEDEEDLSSVITEWLVRDHHVVESVDNGADALELLAVNKYDLIVLDLMLPELSGMEVCRRYRAKGGDAHVLMLTAQSSLDAKEAGLNAGADDYLSKPFELRELVARVRAMLRRPSARIPDLISVGELTIDLRQAKVFRHGAEIRLVPKEFDLLAFLIRHHGQCFSAEALLERVWCSSSTPLTETVRTHVKTIRKKIDSADRQSLIQHIPGYGYKFEL